EYKIPEKYKGYGLGGDLFGGFKGRVSTAYEELGRKSSTGVRHSGFGIPIPRPESRLPAAIPLIRRRRRRQPERHQLAGHATTTNGHDDVLPAIQHVRHR